MTKIWISQDGNPYSLNSTPPPYLLTVLVKHPSYGITMSLNFHFPQMTLITTVIVEETAIQEQNPILSMSPYKTVFNLYN